MCPMNTSTLHNTLTNTNDSSKLAVVRPQLSKPQQDDSPETTRTNSLTPLKNPGPSNCNSNGKRANTECDNQRRWHESTQHVHEQAGPPGGPHARAPLVSTNQRHAYRRHKRHSP